MKIPQGVVSYDKNLKAATRNEKTEEGCESATHGTQAPWIHDHPKTTSGAHQNLACRTFDLSWNASTWMVQNDRIHYEAK